MRNNPKVCVLMSTYNGEKFIKQQLESIFSQEDVEILLVVRDDGSTDNTINVVKKFKYTQLIQGNNVGCEESFRILLHTKIKADYYAFSDQDDVWHPRKLISAINNIQNSGSSLSVCNLRLVNSELTDIGNLYTDKALRKLSDSMELYIMPNLHGCVQVWSANLQTQIQKYLPNTVYPHDTWVNSVANIVSSTYIDNKPYISYRIHDNNTSGYATNIFSRLIKGFRLYFFKRKVKTDELAKDLLLGYGEYLINKPLVLEHLNVVANYKKGIKEKIKLMNSDYINSNDLFRRLLFKFGILFNRF